MTMSLFFLKEIIASRSILEILDLLLYIYEISQSSRVWSSTPPYVVLHHSVNTLGT